MEKVDLYKVLEVSKEASQDEIRRSYRRLARKYHPDANPGDKQAEERFKEIQHAYEVLSQPEKRREYDEGPRAFFGGTQSAGQRRPGGADFEDLSDLLGGFGNLGDIFGRTTSTTPRTRPECGGRGMQSRDQGFFALSTPCSRCGGEGMIIEKPCAVCKGNGRVRRNRQVKVRIPAGAKDGMKIRVPGRGNAGKMGGP